MRFVAPQSWPTLITMVLIAATTNAVFYFSFRWIERQSHDATPALIPFLLIICGLSIGLPSSVFVDFFTGSLRFILYTSLLGTIIHLKSGGGSRLSNVLVRFIYSGFLISLINFSSFALTIGIYSARSSNPQVEWMIVQALDGDNLVWALIIIQSLAAPLLACILKSSRLLPGMDKHLNS